MYRRSSSCSAVIPSPGVEPSQSGVLPEPPFQLDQVTVEQAFPQWFAADEAAFHAVVNHAAVIDQTLATLAAVVVR